MFVQLPATGNFARPYIKVKVSPIRCKDRIQTAMRVLFKPTTELQAAVKQVLLRNPILTTNQWKRFAEADDEEILDREFLENMYPGDFLRDSWSLGNKREVNRTLLFENELNRIRLNVDHN